MPTVGSARAWAIREFRRFQIESPEATADLILGFILEWDRVRVLSRFGYFINEDAWDRFQELVGRRIAGEPLQYLTGEREFYGLAFYVNPEVMIPRPETEFLVEEALNLMRKMSVQEIRFLDVGTGSGCIAVAIVHEMPAAIACATDISAAALQIAVRNAARHGVAGRIHFIQADLLECFPGIPAFDLILSNPPYVALEDYDSLPAVVKNHEPRSALLGGKGGLEVYARLIPDSCQRLKPGGYLLLELGAGQEKHVGQMVEKHGLLIQSFIKDLQGICRCLVARKTR